MQAQITNSTNVMMTTVGNDPYSIGYISLGSMKDSLRAVHIDGVAATAENVQNGTYPLARPFHVVYAQGKALSAQSADFLKFIHSAEGQKIVQDNGYVQVDKGAPAYQAINAEGKIVVAGSSSITPVMEKLAEAYQKYNPNLKIEVQQSDSTTGVQAAIQGTADLGMASRHLKASEQDKVQADVIARDGLAVIVHPQNKVTNLSRDAVRDIYIGKIKSWQEVAK